MERKIGVGMTKALTCLLAFIILFTYLSVTVIGAHGDDKEATDHESERYEAIERMRRGFEEYEESIDISDLNVMPDELLRLFADATKDTPYLFYVSNNLAYSYRTGGGVVSVKPVYTMSRAEAMLALDFCKSEIRKMSLLLADRETELQKLAGAHDLICKRFTYDITLQSNNIYSFLKTGTGTCQGYTWTYMALLRELGIECHYVASDSIAHIWLAVKIDGDWYHSDVTWDDPPGAEQKGIYSRAHLLFSDEKADLDGYKDRYSVADIICESKIYDGNELILEVPPCTNSGDIDHDGRITLYDLILLRLYINDKDVAMQNLCLICADADEDFCIGEGDVEYIRGVLLGDFCR